jgi:hypothetical protein
MPNCFNGEGQSPSLPCCHEVELSLIKVVAHVMLVSGSWLFVAEVKF